MRRSTATWSMASMPIRLVGDLVVDVGDGLRDTLADPLPLVAVAQFVASWSPVLAPLGTAAVPVVPSERVTSTSTVGLPRESRIWRPRISTIVLMAGGPFRWTVGWFSLVICFEMRRTRHFRVYPPAVERGPFALEASKAAFFEPPRTPRAARNSAVVEPRRHNEHDGEWSSRNTKPRMRRQNNRDNDRIGISSHFMSQRFA